MPAVKPRRANRGRMEFLSPEELLAVLKVARERSTHDWAMILLAYRHGLRASEVCGLRLGDIDLTASCDLAHAAPQGRKPRRVCCRLLAAVADCAED